MSSQDSRRGKGFPFLGLSDIQADSYLDESVNAPTSKLDNIPLRLSEYLAGKDTEIEDLPLLEENDVSVNTSYQVQNMVLEEIQELEQIEEMSVTITDSDKSINLELEELPEFIEQAELITSSEQQTNLQNLQLEELPLIEQPQNSIIEEIPQIQESFLNTEALQAVFEKETVKTFDIKEKLEISLPNNVTNLEDESQQAPVFEVTFDPNSSTGRFEKDSLLKEQLESADFYIEQGFLDVAFNTLERLEVLFPNHPLISERLEKMASLEIAHTNSGIPIPKINQISTTKETLPPPNQDVMNENMFRVPNTAELPGLADLSTDEETEMDFNSLVSNNTSDITLVNNVNDDKQKEVATISNIMFEDIPAELYQTITDEIETGADNMLDQIDDAAAEIAAVQNGLKSLIEEDDKAALDEDLEEEFSSRFNVGQAYLDIELYDDAVEEFQAAYRTIQDLGAHPRTFHCCMLLGRCFRLKEMPRPALIWLRKALDTKKYQPNEHVELLYEIANVHEELGEQKKALTVYQEIAKFSPNYQDVAEKIAKLYS
ncbi:MAG: tetratricopeptide repeat protein [Blastocatellia bacterium]|nr:tetratricopeptide repeat protein [Blastocatellia bacterium]